MIELTEKSAAFVMKFVVPAAFVITLPLWCYLVWVEMAFSWHVVAVWTAISLFLLWWTAPIKRVWLDDREFVISNFRKTVRVPLARLSRVGGERWNRTPNVTLIFEPETELGRKIRIIVPWDSRRVNYDRVHAKCSEVLAQNRGHAEQR